MKLLGKDLRLKNVDLVLLSIEKEGRVLAKAPSSEHPLDGPDIEHTLEMKYVSRQGGIYLFIGEGTKIIAEVEEKMYERLSFGDIVTIRVGENL